MARCATWVLCSLLSLSGCAIDGVSEPEFAADDKLWVTFAPSDVEIVARSLKSERLFDIEADPTRGGIAPFNEANLVDLAREMHEAHGQCGGFVTHTSRQEAEDFLTREFPPAEPIADFTIDNPETVRAMIDDALEMPIAETIVTLSAFPSRYYTTEGGVASAEWLADHWRTLIGERTDARVELYGHEWPQPSVILTIDGTDLADQLVIAGAHLDSVSFTGLAPGADDDAAGVAVLTEAARVVLADGFRPRRTIQFIAYAGEEAGMRGSRAIAQQYFDDGVSIAGVMQLDMTNFNGSAGDIYFVDDYTDPKQTLFLSQLVDTYLPELNWGYDTCGYPCSDHVSWNRLGFSVTYPFEATGSEFNRSIHSEHDTFEVSGGNADHSLKFARLLIAYIAELGKGSIDGGEEPGGGDPNASLLLHQVAYDTPGTDQLEEFVELIHVGTGNLDTTDWVLADERDTWSLPSLVVKPGEVLTIARDRDGFRALHDSDPDVSGLSLSLGNSGDTLFLRDSSGVTVDEVGWEQVGWELEARTGESLYRRSGAIESGVSAWTVDSTSATFE